MPFIIQRGGFVVAAEIRGILTGCTAGPDHRYPVGPAAMAGTVGMDDTAAPAPAWMWSSGNGRTGEITGGVVLPLFGGRDGP